MRGLPRVSIEAEAGGWAAVCTCGWETWDQRRPVVDKQAHEHRAKCRPGGAK